MGALIAALWGCAAADAGPDALTVFARASLDLRGVRPSADEAASLLSDPASLDARLDTLPDDPRFGWNLALQLAPVWQTRADESDAFNRLAAVENRASFLASIGEEPLRLVAWIADHDLPWTEVVRADWTVVDPTLADAWPVDYPTGATGWQQVPYVDGRPAAGVLATSGLWWRYTSTYGNANRGRANAVSRILLCNDYLERPVPFDPALDLTDEAAVGEAVQSNPSCVACHAAVDPMGAHLWGFYAEFTDVTGEVARYHPEREDHWRAFGTPPGYFGVPADMANPGALGLSVAQDPRFIQCAVRRTWGALVQREPQASDARALLVHREAMLAGGVTLRALVRSVLRDPAYRALDGDAGAWRLMAADTWASAVEDLTGWRFAVAEGDVMREDRFGVRSLAGYVRSSGIVPRGPSPTQVEVHERWAQQAARHAARHDADAPEDAFLLRDVPVAEEPDEDALRSQIVALHLRVLSQVVAPDAPEVDEELQLWRAIVARTAGDTVEAWAVLIEYLLRDPAFVVY
ncbi:MAG: hypothetical protein RLZZ299_1141 [Pseudomonadota bacterium]